MASLSDKLAASANFEAFAKAEDLQKRIWFTLGALIVYRLGTFIPLPGIDAGILAQVFQQNQGGLLGMFDMFAGGALSRMAILTLNIMPYITASIILQLGTSVLPSLMSLKKEGEAGQRKINQYTRYLTVLITVVQGYAIAVGLEGTVSSTGVSAVVYPGYLFRFTTVISLLGGTMLVVWLGEQITSRGIGNGSSLIITAGIVSGLPSALARTFELIRVGQISFPMLVGIVAVVFGLIYLVVCMERAQRRIVIQYPKRQMGGRMQGGESSHMPLKINPTGVLPPIFASSLLLLPITIVNFLTQSGKGPAWLTSLSELLKHGSPLYIGLYGGLILFFTFFYTAVVFNPEETADNLKKQGGFVAGIRPGKSTADYLDYVLTRITVLGAAYLTSICIFPEILTFRFALPFFLGGTTLLIVVSVTMDLVTQIQSHLIAHQYEGLIKKAKIKGRI